MNEFQLRTIAQAYSQGEEIVYSDQEGGFFYPLLMARKYDTYERHPAEIARKIKVLLESKSSKISQLLLTHFKTSLKGRVSAIDSQLNTSLSLFGIFNLLRHYFNPSFKENLEQEKVALKELDEAIQSINQPLQVFLPKNNNIPLPPPITPGKDYLSGGKKVVKRVIDFLSPAKPSQFSQPSPRTINSPSPTAQGFNPFKTPANRKSQVGVEPIPEGSEPNSGEFKTNLNEIFYVGGGLMGAPTKLSIKDLRSMTESEATKLTKDKIPDDLSDDTITTLPIYVALKITLLKRSVNIQDTPGSGDPEDF